MMIEPGILIAIFTAIFSFTFIYIWKRDILFGGVYLSLFIYTIFTQIGYAYFPELSIFIQAYFGPEIFYDFNLFVSLSFLALFICFFLWHRVLVRRPVYKVIHSRQNLSILFYFFVAVQICVVSLYFISNFDSLSYTSVNDEAFQLQEGIPFVLFELAFKHTVEICFILYFIFRNKGNVFNRLNHKMVLFLLILEITLLITVSTKIGSRTDPLSLTLAIVAYEICIARELKKNIIWKFVKISAVLGLVIYGLSAIEAARTIDLQAQYRTLPERIIFKDYYAPAHILIASMALNYVDPIAVITSNSANALIKLNYPYLQYIVAQLFNPGVSTRSASYAFFMFSEGYIALGWFGFIYNGLIVFLGIALWRSMANSNNNFYNYFLIGLVSTQLANIARSQSSYFVKDVYMIFLPAMFLFFLATGLRPWLGRRAFQTKV